MSRLDRQADTGGIIDYRVLGQLDVRRESEPVPLGSFKQRAVLALLLIHRNEVVSTDRIIDELWGEEGVPDRKNALHVYLSGLRKVLEPERSRREEGSVLLTRAPGYSIRTQPEEVDVDRFERLVSEGRALIAADPASASIVLGEALALWRGLPFEEFTYESFAQVEITRLSELRLEAVEARIDADLARGLSRELVSELEGLVREHAFRERLTGQLMLALYRSGRQAEALRAYQLLRSRLGEELGIEPTGELKKLEEQMVLGDSSLLPSQRGVLPGDEPDFGLSVRGYELREQIGSGRLGISYRAFEPGVGREVAVKVIRPDVADDPVFIRRFEEQAQLVARLRHPNIIPLYDYWREPGAGYMVMRLMQGGSLGRMLESGPLDRNGVATLVAQVGDALYTAHRNGVVHRDVKPENILIDADGDAFLADFGIVADDGIGDPGGMRAPTLQSPYASPERRDGADMSPASDVYSLAMVAAHAITGHGGEISEMMVEMEPAVAAVLDRATSPQPGNRYSDAGAFSEALLAALDVEVDEPRGASDESRNPYKGLRAFQQADTIDFFGRERLVERLVARLGRPGVQGRFMAVVGPSGSGKSSVVKAGLLPALRRDALPGSADWYQIEMTPGPHPFEELEDALLGVAVDPPASLLGQLTSEGGMGRAAGRVLPDEHSQLVVVIDQFEGLYTLADPETANRFLDAIVDAVTQDGSRIRIVVTLRADFYDRPLANRRFGELLRIGTEIVTAMSPEELERAITGPAERVGVEVHPSVVAQMIGEVADRPGALPLLQYALTELFQQHRGSTITQEAYESIGGVAGALGERAEGLLNELDTDARSVVRQLFLRMVSLGEGAEVTRRRVLLSELTSLEGVGRRITATVDTFGRHRLLSFDRDPISRGPTVEISHEALLQEWPRLRRWIEEGRSDVGAHRRLGVAVQEWEANNRSDTYLLSGGRLAQSQGFAESTDLTLTASEREFLQSSYQQQIMQEARRRKRRRLVLAGFAAVGAISLVLAFAALINQGKANDRAELARSRELAAAAINTLDDDPELSVLLALQAADIAEPPLESVSALREALLSHQGVYTYLWPEDREFRIVTGVLRPDGSLLAISNWLDRIEVWDWEADQLLWDFDLVPVPEAGSSVGAAWFMDNGATLVYPVVGTPGGVVGDVTPIGVHVVDALTGEEIELFDFGPCGGVFGSQWINNTTVAGTVVLGMAMLPEDGQCPSNISPDSASELWALDIETGEHTVITSRPDSFYFAAISADGRVVAWSSELENAIHVIDVASDTEVGTVEATGLESGLALSPDGRLLIAGGAPTEVWDVASEELIARFHGHEGGSWLSWFAGEGETAYSSGFDGTARLWDPQTGEELGVLHPGSQPFWVSLSADGSVVATSSTDNTVQAFRLGRGGGLGGPIGKPDIAVPWGGTEVGAGRATLYSCPDGYGRCRLEVRDLSSGDEVWARDDVLDVPAMSPDGDLLAVQQAASDSDTTGSPVILDAASGGEIIQLRGWCDVSFVTFEPPEICADPPDTPFAETVRGMSFSPDGSLLAARGSLWGTLSVWDTESGEMVFVDTGLGGFSEGVAFSPTGDALVVGDCCLARLYDTASWSFTERTESDGDWGPLGGGAAFTPDGRFIVGVPNKGFGPPDIHVLDAETLEGAGPPITDAHDGTIWDIALSPDGTVVATAGGDGFLRIWDWADRELVDEIPLGSEAVAVEFIDDQQLLVATGSGPALVVTTDKQGLIESARARLTRGFDASECAEFGMDPCPTLEEIQGG